MGLPKDLYIMIIIVRKEGDKMLSYGELNRDFAYLKTKRFHNPGDRKSFNKF